MKISHRRNWTALSRATSHSILTTRRFTKPPESESRGKRENSSKPGARPHLAHLPNTDGGSQYEGSQELIRLLYGAEVALELNRVGRWAPVAPNIVILKKSLGADGKKRRPTYDLWCGTSHTPSGPSQRGKREGAMHCTSITNRARSWARHSGQHG